MVMDPHLPTNGFQIQRIPIQEESLKGIVTAPHLAHLSMQRERFTTIVSLPTIQQARAVQQRLILQRLP